MTPRTHLLSLQKYKARFFCLETRRTYPACPTRHLFKCSSSTWYLSGHFNLNNEKFPSCLVGLTLSFRLVHISDFPDQTLFECSPSTWYEFLSGSKYVSNYIMTSLKRSFFVHIDPSSSSSSLSLSPTTLCPLLSFGFLILSI